MTVMSIVVPLVLLAVGLYYTLCPPEKIYTDFGYKTKLTLKNEDIWAFANQYCGKVWIKLGLIMIPISVAVMFIPRTMSENTISAFSVGLFVLQCIATLFSVRHIQGVLKATFDENGIRRSAAPEAVPEAAPEAPSEAEGPKADS